MFEFESGKETEAFIVKTKSTLWARPRRRISSIAVWNLSEFCPKYSPTCHNNTVFKEILYFFLNSIKSNNIPLVLDSVLHSVPGEFGTILKFELFRLFTRGEMLNYR